MLNNYTMIKMMEPYFVKLEEFNDAFVAASAGDITEVIAGTGLTGGATSGVATLNFVGGDGLVVVADSAAIDLATDPGLEFDTAQLKILLQSPASGLELAASGLAMGLPTTLTTTVTNEVTVASHTHTLDHSANPGITASGKILSSTAAGYLQLERLTTPELYSDTNITVDPTSDYVLPATNYDINLGMLSKKYLTLHAAELWVETLVAQDTIATIGGRILVGPTTKLTSDWAVTDLMSSINPSFETGTPGTPFDFDDWIENDFSGGGTIEQKANIVHHGTYSVKLKNITSQPNIRTGDITVTGYTQYVATYWTRADGSSGKHSIYDVTNSTYIVSPTDNGVSGTTWTPITVFFSTESNCTAIRIQFWGATIATNSVWYDLVSLTNAEQTITVEHNQMGQGDFAYLEADGKVEFIGICTAASGTGPYTYNVVRNIDGTGANNWYAGDAIFNLGASPYTTSQGSGFMDLYSFSGMWNSAAIGPTIVGNTWPVPNAELILNNSFELGSGTDPFDFTNWAESPDTNGHITREADPYWGTYSCKLANDTTGESTYVYQNFTTVENTWYRFQIRTRGDGIIGTNIRIDDSTASSATRYLNNPSWGVNITTSWEKYSFFFKTIPGSNLTRVLFLLQNGSSGAAYIDGVEVRQIDYNDYREGWAIGNLNGLYGQGSTTMGVGLGAYESGKDHLLITETGIYFKNYTTTIASWVGDTITLGPTGASTERVVIDSSGIEMYSNNLKVIDLDVSGNVIFGYDASGYSVMEWNYTDKQLQFRNGAGSTIQAYIDTDGTITAAAGDVTLNTDGITIGVGTTYLEGRSVTWKTGSTIVGELYGTYNSGVSESLELRTLGGASAGVVTITAEGSASGYAVLAAQNSSSGVAIKAEYDPAGTGIQWVYTQGHLKVGQGLHVGAYGGSAPSDNNITADGDMRMSGGLTIGSLTTNMAAGDLSMTGSILTSTALFGVWRRDTDTSIATGTVYTVTWQTTEHDTDSFMVSLGTDVNPSRSGTYLIIGEFEWDDGSDSTSRQVIIRKDGSDIAQTRGAAMSGDDMIQQVSCIDYLTSSNNITLVGRHSHGSNLNMQRARIHIARIA